MWRLMEGEERQSALQKIEMLNNRAVFEIPIILDHLLAEAACTSSGIKWEAARAGRLAR